MQLHTIKSTVVMRIEITNTYAWWQYWLFGIVVAEARIDSREQSQL
jgi:hypothetical protein